MHHECWSAEAEFRGVIDLVEMKAVVYTGDTSMNSGIVPAIKNADVFLCDAGCMDADKGKSPKHLSAAEAGLVASLAKVDRLYLTHLHPLDDEEALLGEAKANFADTQAALEGRVIEV